MQIETLRLFCDLVEARSFSLAAEKHRLSQSAVSQRIAALEKELGVRLLMRRRNTEPTTEGMLLLENAHRMLALYDDCLRRLREIQQPVEGLLRISTVYSIGLHELPPYLKWFRDHYPNAEVRVEYHRSGRVYREVAEGRADLGFVAFPDCRAYPELVCDTFWQDQLVLILPPGHALAGRNPVRLAELNGSRFIAFEPDLPTRKAIDAMLAKAQVRIDELMALDNVELVKRAVEVENAVAIVPQRTVYAEVRGGRLLEAKLDVPEGETARPLGMVSRAGEALSPAAQEFTELIRNERLF
jgi:DNA-binding transcriptional LysR family regulator